MIDAGLTLTDVDNTSIAGGATVKITGGYVNGEDVLSFTNTANITGNWNATTGTLTLTGTDTVANYQAALRSVKYQNTNTTTPSTATRTVTFSATDLATGGLTGTTTRDISVIPVNDAPTLSATASSATFTEGGAAASLFTGTSISTIEAGQNIQTLKLTLSNVSDGANEVLNIDGSTVALTNGNSVTTATNSMTASVVLSGGTATVTITKTGGISTAAAQTLVDGISYQNNSQNPTAGNRVATLTSIQDTGGTANGGLDTTTLSVADTTTVVAVNDAPTLSNNGFSAQGGITPLTHTISTSELNATDVDNTDAELTYTVTTLPTKGVLKVNGSPISAGGTFTQADLAAGKVTYTPNSGQTGNDSFTFDLKDPSGAGKSAQVANITMTQDATPPQAPTVNALRANTDQPVITGTFDANDHAGGFTVTVDGKTYTLGTDAALTASGNTWSLDLSRTTQKLADGKYDVVATATDASGNTASDKTNTELQVATSSASQLDIASGFTFKVQTNDLNAGTQASTGTVGTSTVGSEHAGTPVIDTYAATAAQTTLSGQSISSLHASRPPASVQSAASRSNAAFDVNNLAPTGAGNEKPGAGQKQGAQKTSGQKVAARKAGSEQAGNEQAGSQQAGKPQAAGQQPAAQGVRGAPLLPSAGFASGPDTLLVSKALQGQIKVLSRDVFQVVFPDGVALNGDVIFVATRPDGRPLPDYVHIDPDTGKITILRNKAPLGLTDIVVKVTRIMQNGGLKDVKSTTFRMTIEKEAKVKLGEGQTAGQAKSSS